MARRAAVALVLILDAVALVVCHEVGVRAAAGDYGRGRCIGRRNNTVLGDPRHNPLAALALAALLIRQSEALGLRLIARALAAARRLSRALGRGGPHRLAVHVLVHRLECAAFVAVLIFEHQTLALGVIALALIHPPFAVRDVGVAIAAARLERRRRRRFNQALHIHYAVDDEMARARPLALCSARARIAHRVRLERVALAAAHLLGRRRRLGGRHLTVARVIRHQKRAAHVLTALLGGGLGAAVILFVVIAVAAARRLSGRLRRRGPQRLAVHVLVHRLEHAARHAVLIDLLQALAFRVKTRARVLPPLRVRARRVHVAAAGLLRRLRGAKGAFIIHITVFDEVAARRALALIARRALVAHRVGFV